MEAVPHRPNTNLEAGNRQQVINYGLASHHVAAMGPRKTYGRRRLFVTITPWFRCCLTRGAKDRFRRCLASESTLNFGEAGLAERAGVIDSAYSITTSALKQSCPVSGVRFQFACVVETQGTIIPKDIEAGNEPSCGRSNGLPRTRTYTAMPLTTRFVASAPCGRGSSSEPQTYRNGNRRHTHASMQATDVVPTASCGPTYSAKLEVNKMHRRSAITLHCPICLPELEPFRCPGGTDLAGIAPDLTRIDPTQVEVGQNSADSEPSLAEIDQSPFSIG